MRHRIEETCGLFGQIGIGRHGRELIFPKIEILPCEGCEIRLIGHGFDYSLTPRGIATATIRRGKYALRCNIIGFLLY